MGSHRCALRARRAPSLATGRPPLCDCGGRCGPGTRRRGGPVERRAVGVDLREGPSSPATGRGVAWEAPVANHELLRGWLVDEVLTAVKAGELLARRGTLVPRTHGAPLRPRGARRRPLRPGDDGASCRWRARSGVPGRLREDGRDRRSRLMQGTIHRDAVCPSRAGPVLCSHGALFVFFESIAFSGWMWWRA
jgi:hypothetical protein